MNTTETKKIFSILEKQYQNNRLSHAYLIIGPQQSGKQAVLDYIIAKILKTDRFLTHPDYRLINIADISSVDSLRQLITELSGKPFVSDKRVIVFDKFETATHSQASTLLKFIEEAPPSTIIFISSRIPNVLPTIISRTQVFTLNGKGLEITEQNKDVLKQLQGIENLADYQRLILASRLAELEKEQLQELLNQWMQQIKKQLAVHPKLYTYIRQAMDAHRALSQNVNKKMVTQKLVLG